MEQRTVTIKNFLRITKIVQVSAMKVHFQIAERSLFYLNPDIHYRRMTYPPERGGTGILDVHDISSNIIYDFKFGKTARMSKSQYYKYSNSFPNSTITIIKRQ